LRPGNVGAAVGAVGVLRRLIVSLRGRPFFPNGFKDDSLKA
jgi:hypothetical protein